MWIGILLGYSTWLKDKILLMTYHVLQIAWNLASDMSVSRACFLYCSRASLTYLLRIVWCFVSFVIPCTRKRWSIQCLDTIYHTVIDRNRTTRLPFLDRTLTRTNWFLGHWCDTTVQIHLHGLGRVSILRVLEIMSSQSYPPSDILMSPEGPDGCFFWVFWGRKHPSRSTVPFVIRPVGYGHGWVRDCWRMGSTGHLHQPVRMTDGEIVSIRMTDGGSHPSVFVIRPRVESWTLSNSAVSCLLSVYVVKEFQINWKRMISPSCSGKKYFWSSDGVPNKLKKNDFTKL